MEPKLAFRQALQKAGLVKGMHISWRGAPGRPFACWPQLKVAVVIHSEKNAIRSEKAVRALVGAGWAVASLAETELEANAKAAASVVLALMVGAAAVLGE